MRETQTASRALTHTLMRHVARLLAGHRETWAQAMAAEANGIESDVEALAWAIGCVRAGYSEKLRQLSLHMPTIASPFFLATVVTGLFVSLFISLDEYLAALAYPEWYAAFTDSYRHFGFHLWGFLKLGIPEAVLAALCAATLAQFARRSEAFIAAIGLSVWVVTPFAADLLEDDVSFADYFQGFFMYWPDIAFRLVFVSVTFLWVFRCVTSINRARLRAACAD